MRVSSLTFVAALLVTAPRLLTGQERGAAALSEAVRGLGVTTRVLMIGAHPDDEDTPLLTWLARGQRVETAYLSLTRGEGGQNLIGNELGDALGVVRTEELLAARRVDGARQYFTRAYDFGFSKTAAETYEHWDREVLLRDVVSVVRAFRPHVIIAVFSGTPRDGHGHHQVAGMLARDAFEVAGDTTRMPAHVTGGVGAWTPLKFYRAARFDPARGTLRINVGEYDPVRGRSFAEIAGESRSQHRSQAFGALQPKGVRWDHVTLEASRVSDVREARAERSLFAGLDSGVSRFAALALPASGRAALDSLPGAAAAVTGMLRLREPSTAVAPLARYVRLARTALDVLTGVEASRGAPVPCPVLHVPLCGGPLGDLVVSLQVALQRGERALAAAAGIALDATTTRSRIGLRDTAKVSLELFNRGQHDVALRMVRLRAGSAGASKGFIHAREIAADSVWRDTLDMAAMGPTRIWWLHLARVGDMYSVGGPGAGPRAVAPEMLRGEDALEPATAVAELEVAGARVRIAAPIVHRYADPAEGEVRQPITLAPPIEILLDRPVEYVPADRPVVRTVRVTVKSSTVRERRVSVSLELPAGLRADVPLRTVTLRPYAQATVDFTVRGSLPAGVTAVRAVAVSEGSRFTTGYVTVEYPHITPRYIHRPAATRYAVVEVQVPAGIRVAYIPGAGDDTPAMLEQLGVPLTVLDTASLASADLSGFTTLVVGPRAYETSDALVAANARILDFARRGGTVVVQYGQYEMMRPGLMPYPVTIGRPHDRVTLEEAPVRILDPAARLLRSPNAITPADFDGWVQERGLYMPRAFDPAYVPLLEMHDPGEPPNRGAVLVAPYGRGTYVYTTLSFFRQLPAGVPGAARLFMNLLGAGMGSR